MPSPSNEVGIGVSLNQWTQSALIEAMQKLLRFDALAFGIIDVNSPALDELLAVHDIEGKALTKWCEAGFRQDRLLQGALRRGIAVAGAEEFGEESPLPILGNAMVHMVADDLATGRWWWLLMMRQEKAFSPLEQNICGLGLKQWQVEFDHLPEAGMGKLLLGHDDRLIHADPYTQTRLLENAQFLDQLRQSLHTVQAQRWPRIDDGAGHDFAVDLAGAPTWVCFHRHRAVDDPHAYHWYVELRPLDEGELPTIGPIDDTRVAQAVAFLHDNFASSPSLARVADVVHISPFHFHRVFSKLMGVSPKQYLQRKQLQVAKWLLRSSRVPIGTVAARTGFSSHGHFTATFHRVIGVSPSEYREGH